MRSFLIRLMIFAVLPLAAVTAAVFRADGTTDAFYLRFATPKATSMVLGTSRAAQGIRPDVLDSTLAAGGWQVSSFNYAFAKGISNYGPAYLASVLRKLDRSSTEGVFVLAVDPWCLEMRQSDGDGAGWSEDQKPLARVHAVAMRPNPEYLFTGYNAPILTVLFPGTHQRSDMVLHENGWLEVRIDLSPRKVAWRTEEKLKEYRANAIGSRLSPFRMAFLHAMIDSLAPYGTPLLVRLPVPDEMLAIEDATMPQLDAVMESTARSKGIQYLNFTRMPGHWSYTDGNHLTADETVKVSAAIGGFLLRGKQAKGTP
jgi:hypothetical protein